MALSIGAIIGITAGCAVVIIIIIGIALYCVYTGRSNAEKTGSPRTIVQPGLQPLKVPIQNGVQANGHVQKVVYKHVQRPAQRMHLQSFKFEPTALTTREKVGSLTYDLPYRRVQQASFAGRTPSTYIPITPVPQSPTDLQPVLLRTPREGQKVSGFGQVAIKSDGGDIHTDGGVQKKKIRNTYRPAQPLPGHGHTGNQSPKHVQPLPDRLSHVIQTTPFTKIEQPLPTSPSQTSFRNQYISVPEPKKRSMVEGYVVHPYKGGRVSTGSQKRY